MSSPFMGSWRAAPEGLNRTPSRCPPHLWGVGSSPRSGEVPPLAAGMGRRRRKPSPPAGSVMLGGLGLQSRILSGAIPRVAADHPPTETDNAQPGDQERHAHPEPSGNPFTGEKDHGSTLSPTDDLRPLRAGRVLPGKGR